MNPFSNYRDSYVIKDNITKPNIIVGDYSYYAGFHHGKHFEENVWYLDKADKGSDEDKLIIGKFCSIASGATFMLSGNQGHRHDWITTFPLDVLEEQGKKKGRKAPVGYLPKGDTVIGNDVWIGAEAMFMPGVKVGDGAVIGTRALITKDVEPYAIVGGNPARLIKKRFSDEDIAILLELRWWDWPVEKIRANIAILRSGEVKRLREVA